MNNKEAFEIKQVELVKAATAVAKNASLPVSISYESARIIWAIYWENHFEYQK